MLKSYTLKGITVLFFTLYASLAFANSLAHVTTYAVTPLGYLTQISEELRGQTLTGIDADVTADEVPLATEYRFRVINGADVQTIDVPTNTFKLTQLATFAYNTTYTIDVAVRVDGDWYSYGDAYNITTPAPVT
ncbi:MAG: hypothetical protein EOP51_25395, partial [Sphingobacteriales bacterium]